MEPSGPTATSSGAVHPDARPANVVPEPFQDPPGPRVERDELAAPDARDEESAARVDRESVGSVDGRPTDEDLRLIPDGARGVVPDRLSERRGGVAQDHEGHTPSVPA